MKLSKCLPIFHIQWLSSDRPHWGSKTGGVYCERTIIEMVIKSRNYHEGSQFDCDYSERAIIEGTIIDHLLKFYPSMHRCGCSACLEAPLLILRRVSSEPHTCSTFGILAIAHSGNIRVVSGVACCQKNALLVANLSTL